MLFKVVLFSLALVTICNGSCIPMEDKILPEIFLKALINAGSTEQQQLLNNPLLANATEPYHDTIIEIVRSNLIAIEMLSKAEEENKCVIEPSRKCSKTMEKARDSGFLCMEEFLRNLEDFNDYQSCLKNVISVAMDDINLLQPVIDACAGLSTSNTATNKPEPTIELNHNCSSKY